MFYRVTLINDAENDAYADIVWMTKSDTYMVVSSDPRMKATIEAIVSRPLYTLSPGANIAGYASDGVTLLDPGTPYYFESLPEILGWRGFRATFHGEAHKSMTVNYIPNLSLNEGYTLKNITTNEKGERIVQRVPQGFIAVNINQNKYLTAGQWLNANIDKEDAEWYLEPNPYEDMSEEKRQLVWGNMAAGFMEYDMAANPAAYGEGAVGEMTPEYAATWEPSDKAIRLSEHPDFVRELAEAVEEVKEAVVADKKEIVANTPDYSATLFSPTLGVAVDSDIFDDVKDQLPEGWEKHRWFAAAHPPTGKPNPRKKKMVSRGRLDGDPRYLPGTEEGLVKTHVREDGDEPWRATVEPWRMNARPGDMLVTLNDLPPTIDIDVTNKESEFNSPAEVEKRRVTRDKVKQHLVAITDRIGGGLDRRLYNPDKAREIKVEGLYVTDEDRHTAPPDAVLFQGGFYPNGQERGYQKAIVGAITDMSQYERGGGPKGAHGHMVNATYGVGKTAMGIMSWLTFRNKGVFQHGKQTMLVTAPNKMTENWALSYAQFTGEDVVVVQGDKAEREAIWRSLMERAAEGNLPGAVIVPASAFRKATELEDPDNPFGDKDASDEDGLGENIEPSAEVLAMRLLARGGTFGNGDNAVEVPGGHIGLMTIDESGQFVNAETNKTKFLWDVIDDVYKTSGLTLTLNGDISGNSAGDTITEMSLINAGARGATNYYSLLNHLTQDFRPDDGKGNVGSGKNSFSKRRAWVSSKAIRSFWDTFGSVTPMTGEMVAGSKFGLSYTDPVTAEMGATWGNIYNKASSFLTTAMTIQGAPEDEEINALKAKALGLQSVLIGASYGSAHPARLIEYGVGEDEILKTIVDDNMLSPENYEELVTRLREFKKRAMTTIDIEGVRFSVPDTENGLNAKARETLFKDIMGEDFYRVIDEAVTSWDCPALDEITEGIHDEITKKKGLKGGKPLKLGVGGFSRRAVERIHKQLQEKYGHPGSNVMINIITGDTSSKEVADIEARHQGEKKKTVITLVTAAAKYGISLPADRSWSFPSWNPATGRQVVGRFHRSPLQSHISTTVMTGGMTSYIQHLSEAKDKVIRDAMRALTVDDVERGIENDDLEFDGEAVAKMLDFISSEGYRPTVRQKEKGRMTAKEREAIASQGAEKRQKLLDDVAARRKEAEEKEAEILARIKETRVAKSTHQASPVVAKPPVKKNSRSVVPIKKYDAPTLTRNPFYREED